MQNIKELHDAANNRSNLAAALVASQHQQQQQLLSGGGGGGDDASSDGGGGSNGDLSRSGYTSRTTGQPVSMDLCVVCGDRASGTLNNSY